MNTAIEVLAALKYQEAKDKFPGVPEYAIPQTKYSDKTANDLTRCIMDFIKVTGAAMLKGLTQWAVSSNRAADQSTSLQPGPGEARIFTA